MGETVLADAQFTLARVLKPFNGFEDIYQGQSAAVPVAFFEADANGQRNPRDPDAGRPGFNPNLLRYVNVPFGSRVLLWVPATIRATGDTIQQTNYIYTVYWRLRTPTDYRNRRTPFHQRRQFPGQPDTSVTPAGQRIVLPAATRTVVINQTEAVGSNSQVQNLRREAIEFLSTFLGLVPYTQLPLLPDSANGVHQQGVLDPGTFSVVGRPNAFKALFMPLWFDCEGDQMLVCAERDPASPDTTWDFEGIDAPFSNIYGTNVLGPTHALFEDLGIYLFTGSNP